MWKGKLDKGRQRNNNCDTKSLIFIINFFNIHGVSLNQKIDSVKHLLDYNTLQILKVLLQDIEAPAQLDYLTTVNVCKTIDIIQSRLSNDNKQSIPTIGGGDGI